MPAQTRHRYLQHLTKGYIFGPTNSVFPLLVILILIENLRSFWMLLISKLALAVLVSYVPKTVISEELSIQ